MALTNVSRRATTLADSDNAEQNKIGQLLVAGWVINSPTMASNATTVSYGSHAMIVNGVLQIFATNTLAVVGTIAATSTGIFIYTRSVAGTASAVLVAAATGASIGTIAFPTIPASQVVFGMTIVACTATAFNGATNSFADAAY